jgi:uncharacterized protein YacL
MGIDQSIGEETTRIDLIEAARNTMALLFTGMFLVFAAYLTGLASLKFLEVFSSQKEPVETLIKAINLGIIGLAIFELAVSIHKEYSGRHAHVDFFSLLRRGVAQFVGTVCIALVMEGLIMAIKYSQLDLAGNLYYAVAIVISAAVLLAALGIFLRLSAPAETAEALADTASCRPPHTTLRDRAA